ncbi:MAG TPA: hypothetical protein VNJ04_11415 [Gemmatimonadaceae bacterium]|nr:hypothetical protein [Gemmatimonadaceae bacterium]
MPTAYTVDSVERGVQVVATTTGRRLEPLSDLHRLSIRRVGLFIATMAVACVVLLALGF